MARALAGVLELLDVDTLRDAPRVNAIVPADHLRANVTGPSPTCGTRSPIGSRTLSHRCRLPFSCCRGERDPMAGREWWRRLSARGAAGRVAQIDPD